MIEEYNRRKESRSGETRSREETENTRRLNRPKLNLQESL
jgi:hypothetical protein